MDLGIAGRTALVLGGGGGLGRWRLYGLGLGLIHRNGLGGLRAGAAACPDTGQLLVQLVDPLTQIRVLLDQPGQLVFHQVEEGVDLVFVVASLADGRLTERHIVDVGGCKWHS